MSRIVFAVVVLLLFTGSPTLAQGVAPGGPIGGSTGMGSGLGIPGTGPSWPNGSNPAPQPVIPHIPPGGYPSPAPPSSYTPQPSVAAPPTTRPSLYPQPNEPFAATSVRPPASIPLVLPDRPGSDLAFLRGCWRTDIFSDGPRKATLTWCFDDKGAGRYLYSRTDQGSFYCHGQAQAQWKGQKLDLASTDPACDDRSIKVPGRLACDVGTDGAVCTGAGETPAVRLYRVR